MTCAPRSIDRCCGGIRSSLPTSCRIRAAGRALVALRRFLAYAYDEGWIAPELSRQVMVPRYVVGDPHPVPTADVPKLLAALPTDGLRDLRDRALVHLLMST